MNQSQYPTSWKGLYVEVSLVYNIDNLALKRIAEIHKLNYPSDHLTSQFTSDMLCDYYRLIADLSDYIILAHYKGEIIGFAFLGGSFGSVLPSLVMNNKLKILNFTIRRPSIVLGFVLNKFFTENYHLDSSSNIRLISITTDKFFRKLRVGTHIVTKLENLQVEKNILAHFIIPKIFLFNFINTINIF